MTIPRLFTVLISLGIVSASELSSQSNAVPELPDYGRTITIRHLVHHTSGLRDQWAILGLAGWRFGEELITERDVLRVISRQRSLDFEPGTEWSYSNTGYTLLAVIAKRITGKTLREFTAERIFGPLGMHRTHFHDDHAMIVKGRTAAYVPWSASRTSLPMGMLDTPYDDLVAAAPTLLEPADQPSGEKYRIGMPIFDVVGATSLFTTVEDLFRWDQSLYSGRVGGELGVRQMLERGILSSGDTLDYAFGLRKGDHKGLTSWRHSGSDVGFQTDYLRIPEERFGVAVLCNNRVAPAPFADQVADIILANRIRRLARARRDVETRGPSNPISLSEGELSAKAGFYRGTNNGDLLRVEFAKGKLVLAGRELIPLGSDRFQFGPEPRRGVYIFESGPDGIFIRRPQPNRAGGSSPDLRYRAVPAASPTSAELEKYAGEYWSEELDVGYSFVVENGKLVLRRTKFEDDPLEPTIVDGFAATRSLLATRFEFTRDAPGEIVGFAAYAGRARAITFARRRQ